MAKDKTDIIVPPSPEPTAENTLKVKSKTGVVYPIHLYDTAAGAGDAGNGTDVLNVGGKYARMTTNLSGTCGKDTPLRVKKGGNIYQVAQYGEYRANPVDCLYVHENNPNHDFAKRDYGWIGDGESAYYEYHWSDSGSNSNFNYIDVTVPRNCNIVRLEGYGGQTSNNAIFIQVTAGKTYRLVSWRGENVVPYTQHYQKKSGIGKDARYYWTTRDATYIQNRYRQLIFTYPEFKNDGSVKTIIVTNASTDWGGFKTYKYEHFVNGKSRTDILNTGANDAQWGEAGFMRVCFGKGYFNYEANAPQDTML